MKKLLLILFFFIAFMQTKNAIADEVIIPPDTVKVGVYFISLHDIDFRQKESR